MVAILARMGSLGLMCLLSCAAVAVRSAPARVRGPLAWHEPSTAARPSSRPRPRRPRAERAASLRARRPSRRPQDRRDRRRRRVAMRAGAPKSSAPWKAYGSARRSPSESRAARPTRAAGRDARPGDAAAVLRGARRGADRAAGLACLAPGGRARRERARRRARSGSRSQPRRPRGDLRRGAVGAAPGAAVAAAAVAAGAGDAGGHKADLDVGAVARPPPGRRS